MHDATGMNRSNLLLAFAMFVAMGVALSGAFPSLSTASTGVAINQKVLAGDGSRFVSYLRPDGVPVVLDSRSSEVQPIKNAKGCLPQDVSRVRVVLFCGAKVGPTFRTASTRGGHATKLGNFGLSGDEIDHVEIGDYWVRGEYSAGPHDFGVIYANWRNGESKSCSFGCRFAYSLDRKKLTRDRNFFDTRWYRRHFPQFWNDASSFNGIPISKKKLSLVAFRGKFYLCRRSDNQPRRVGPAVGYNSFPPSPKIGVTIDSGVVTWVQGKDLHVVKVHSLRRKVRHLHRKGAAAVPVKDGVVLASTIPGRGSRNLWRIRIIPSD